MIREWMRRTAIGGAVAAMLVLAVNAPVRPARPSSASIRRLDADGVIRQRRTDDCGIATVAMLLRRVGTPVDLDGLWAELGPTPGGETLRELMNLAGPDTRTPPTHLRAPGRGTVCGWCPRRSDSRPRASADVQRIASREGPILSPGFSATRGRSRM